MIQLLRIALTAAFILGWLLSACTATAADSCVIDTVTNGMKSRECVTNKLMSSEQFHEFCTAMGKSLKDALKENFDYSVTFQSSCPDGWAGYCDVKTSRKYVYTKAYVAKNKKGCTPDNPIMPGEWHDK